MPRLGPLLLFLPLLASSADFRPNLGPDLPRIEITCGDVTVLLRQESQWTPERFDFRGKPMTTEKSAYGTVFLFPEIGFIGTNHLEVEPEDLQSLSFSLDGEEIAKPGPVLTGATFTFERRSRIRDFELHNRFEIRDNRIHETATVAAKEDVPLKLVYHFMHAWRPTASAFLAGKDGETAPTHSGPLHDGEEVARQFFINDAVDWVAIYEPESGQFAVSRLLESPAGVKQSSKIWNVPDAYRKFYLINFHNETVPAGFEGTWRMVTGFGAASDAEWEKKAVELAERLRTEPEPSR